MKNWQAAGLLVVLAAALAGGIYTYARTNRYEPVRARDVLTVAEARGPVDGQRGDQ